jgi:predicted acylesterase/phospholipase RssA
LRTKGKIDMAKPFKILSLDGGGTWALIQAKVLADLFPGQTGHQILARFDVVASTSGGSIVVAGLMEDKTPDQIFDLFNRPDNRNLLFSKLLLGEITELLGIGPRFSTAAKLAGLQQLLPVNGGKPFGSIRIQNLKGNNVSFLMTSYDYDRDRAHFMRSNANSATANFPRDPEQATVAEAVHASTNAPINYFDEPAAANHHRYWDGAMTGYNNPMLVAIMEAFAQGVAKQDIGVLSIGTGSAYLPLPATGLDADLSKDPDGTGIATVIKKGVRAVLSDPPDAHSFIAHLVLGGGLPAGVDQCPYGNTPIIRMNPLIQPVIQDGQWAFPTGWDEEDFHKLAEMDMAVTDQNDVNLITRFCTDWMGASRTNGGWHNQPVRSSGSLFVPPPGGILLGPAQCCEIGHFLYQDAKAAWGGL